MAAATLVAVFGIQRGVQQEADQRQLNLPEEPKPAQTSSVRLVPPRSSNLGGLHDDGHSALADGDGEWVSHFYLEAWSNECTCRNP